MEPITHLEKFLNDVGLGRLEAAKKAKLSRLTVIRAATGESCGGNAAKKLNSVFPVPLSDLMSLEKRPADQWPSYEVRYARKAS